MKKMKNILCLFLALVLLCGALPRAEAEGSRFIDVEKGKWYYDAVMWAVDNGITGGMDETHFGPNKACTREQVVTFLWAASGKPEPLTSHNPFADVKSTKYYYKAVLWAVENGITSGVSSTKFGVGITCTRAQVVTFIYAAAGNPSHNVTNNPFTDVKESKYYYNAVLWAVSNGITSGTTPTNFGPNKECTRGHVVVFLYQYDKLKNPNVGDVRGSYNVTFWLPAEIIDLTKTQVERFNNNNSYGITIHATYKATVFQEILDTIKSTSNAARPDLYLFPQDQTYGLINCSALSKVPSALIGQVTSSNVDTVLTAAAKDGDLYAYPITADNGYFLYYDKRVVSDAHAGSLEQILSDCMSAGKKFAMNLSSGWYSAGFFFGAGCKSQWEVDADGGFVGYTDTFNSANGIKAAKALRKVLTSGAWIDEASASKFSSGAAAVVSGTWDYSAATEILGNNLGAAAMPCVTVDGESIHLGSFMGCKLLGVKPQSNEKRSNALHVLALYLAGRDCQLERFNTVSWGPSNALAQRNKAVQASPAIKALLSQTPYSVPQGQIPEKWWSLMSSLASELKSATTDQKIKNALTKYATGLDSALTK